MGSTELEQKNNLAMFMDVSSLHLKLTIKGQLISKADCQAVNSSEKQMNDFFSEMAQ